MKFGITYIFFRVGTRTNTIVTNDEADLSRSKLRAYVYVYVYAYVVLLFVRVFNAIRIFIFTAGVNLKN